MWRYPWAAFSLAVVVAATVGAACRGSTALLTRLLEARRLASELHVAFTKASEASTRAVMGSSDDASAAAADEAKRARQEAERSLGALQPVLESPGYQTDVRYLSEFKTRFDEYRRLDDEILTLAVENSNIKAQRIASAPHGRRLRSSGRRSRQLFAVARRTAVARSCCGPRLWCAAADPGPAGATHGRN